MGNCWNKIVGRIAPLKCFPFEGAKRGTAVNECPVGIHSLPCLTEPAGEKTVGEAD